MSFHLTQCQKKSKLDMMIKFVGATTTTTTKLYYIVRSRALAISKVESKKNVCVSVK